MSLTMSTYSPCKGHLANCVAFLAYRDRRRGQEPEGPLHATGYANGHTLWPKWLTFFVAWYPNIFVSSKLHTPLKLYSDGSFRKSEVLLHFRVFYIFKVCNIKVKLREQLKMSIFKCVPFCTIIRFAENEVLTTLIVRTTIFWDVTPCSLQELLTFRREILPSSSGLKIRPR
jgi:hypothetical protein